MSRDVTYIAGMAIIHIADTLHVHATPFGFNTYAAEFLDSARQFKTSPDFSPLRYYLVRRSIELSLKCFLPGKGVSKKGLVTEYHHLIKLPIQARRLGVAMQEQPRYRNNKNDFNMTVIGRGASSQVFYSSRYFQFITPPIFQWISVTSEAYGCQSAVILEKLR